MALITWREDYRVGVAVVDSEHQYLFDLINEFHDAYATGRSARDLLMVLTRLVAYAERHFQHEEALMHHKGYPRLAHHQREHERLYSSIYQLAEQVSRNAASVDRETMRFLKHWLVDHILQEDLTVGDFIKAKGTREAHAAATATDATGEVAEDTDEG